MLFRVSPSQVCNLSEILFFHLKFHSLLVRLSCPCFILQQEHQYITAGEPFPNNSCDSGELERDANPSWFWGFFLTKACNSPEEASPIYWFSDNLHQSWAIWAISKFVFALQGWGCLKTQPQLQPILYLLACPCFSVFLSTYFSSTMATLNL